MTRRMERINVQLRRELSDLLAHEVKDPRLPTLVSVTHVETSIDLRSARVFVSILGGEQDKVDALAGLASAAGFLHRELMHRLAIRHIPQLHFVLDDSIEKGAQMLQEIDQVTRGQEHKK